MFYSVEHLLIKFRNLVLNVILFTPVFLSFETLRRVESQQKERVPFPSLIFVAWDARPPNHPILPCLGVLVRYSIQHATSKMLEMDGGSKLISLLLLSLGKEEKSLCAEHTYAHVQLHYAS